LSVKGAEEVTEMAIIFNRTITNLKMAISRIQTQASAIASTSQQLSQSSDNQASSLSEQAVAITQVSVTVQELSQTSQRIADSSAQVATSANAALESAQNGYDTLLGVSETMSEIRQKVNMIADRILALNTIAQRIRDVTSLINTISNETHLLALNAAIESAGAGEEGARFAVVAGQVRKLSQRSRVAAVEIQQLVSQIQRATAASVMATEEGIKASTLGEKMVMDSLEANEQIIGQVTQTNEQAQSISLATDQQRVVSTQLAETLREVSRIINTISVNSQQYRLSAANLGNVVNQLNSVANGFVLHQEIPVPPLKLVPATATTV
jgi:methyl-accepting chemotaxis protein